MSLKTIVFEVPNGTWLKLDPFKIKTPFGPVVTLAKGNLVADRKEIEAALDRRGLFLFAHVDGSFTIQEK